MALGSTSAVANRQSVRPSITFALLQELIHRDALRIALAGRDDVTLEPILTFLVRHITDPRFGEMASEVAGVIIDIYTPVLGQSPLLDEMLSKLQNRIDGELRFQREVMKLRGALDMTLAQAAMSQLSEGRV